MKKFLIFLFAMIVFDVASATTINLSWIVEGDTYAQTTCESGADLILPTNPTKRGYHFVGWSISDYTQLDYIESTGTQYINTKVKAYNNYKYNVEFEVPAEPSGWVFGSSVSSAGAQGDFGVASSGIRFGNKYVLDLDFKSMGRVSVSVDKTGYEINGLRINWDAEATMTASAGILLFWAVNSSSAKTGKIYSFSVKDANDYRILNLVPAKRNTDNVVGMYDTISKRFFTNAGTGNFVGGPISATQTLE